MIVRFPTGLYKNVIPLEGNVTFTVSSQNPPRSNQSFLQIPEGERLKPLPKDAFTKQERRVQLGELLYTVDAANQTVAGSNRTGLATGDILDFTEPAAKEDVSATEVPGVVDIQYNTQQADLSAFGLTNAEILDVNRSVAEQREDIRAKITNLQADIADYKEGIRENQKSQNEAVKVIQGLLVFYDAENETVKKVEDTLAELRVVEAELIDLVNSSNVTIKELYNDYLEVSRLA